MSTTTTNVKQVKMNIMTQQQYDQATKSSTELYMVTDAEIEASTLTGLTASITELNYVDGVTSAIQTQLNGKQATLVSGTNIKTINSTSLLGSGDISVQPVISSSAMLSSDLVDDTNNTHKFATAAQLSQISTNTGDISTINGKIPAQATSSNQLADKAFVNSSVQTATANFRGNWDTWSDVPTSSSSYPADYAGSTTPTVNDYMVVQDASDYTGDTLEGTWRFKYSGTWSTDGKSGWLPEYQVNETPLTSAQLAALNSGITSSDVALIGTALQPNDNISDLTDDTATYPIDKAESVVDNNSGSLTFWSGTKAEYDAIVTKDANTLYNVEDTTSPIISILDSLYPVGSIYIGTMSACPLATLGIGTWQLVATDRVLQGAGTRGSVGTTVNESLPNIIGDVGNDSGIGHVSSVSYGLSVHNTSISGAFYANNNCSYTATKQVQQGTDGKSLGFDASRSSSTYQDNAPVQQDAYLVNIWERIS